MKDEGGLWEKKGGLLQAYEEVRKGNGGEKTKAQFTYV